MTLYPEDGSKPIRERFEACLLRVAAWILDRNARRAGVVSRRDNSWIDQTMCGLRCIADRIESGYVRNSMTKALRDIAVKEARQASEEPENCKETK